MFLIAETFIDNDIPRAHFSCDVGACKGACCTLEGGRGAPLEEEEIEEIHRAFPVIRKYLSPEHLSVIDKSGLYEGPPGSRATTCVNEHACVFAFFEEGIARCSFERGYINGETKWRKPISCHLFPIRASRFGPDVLRYEQIAECKAGRAKGEADGTTLVEFLKDPLVRKFGETWYDSFRKECQNGLKEPAKS